VPAVIPVGRHHAPLTAVRPAAVMAGAGVTPPFTTSLPAYELFTRLCSQAANRSLVPRQSAPVPGSQLTI